MMYLSVTIVAQVDVHQLLLISHRRRAIMADKTNIAKKLQSDDLMYKAVMTKYELAPGTQVYRIAGRLYTKEPSRSDGALYWHDLETADSFWSAPEAWTATVKRSSNFADVALPNAPGSSSAAVPQRVALTGDAIMLPRASATRETDRARLETFQ